MISARAFVLLWATLSAAVLAYALIDLHVSPSLWAEQSFSMQPDFTQIWEIRHWGGRLVREGAWGLLLPNAFVLGGLGALIVHAVLRRVSRPKLVDAAPRNSIAPPSAPSIPPPPV